MISGWVDFDGVISERTRLRRSRNGSNGTDTLAGPGVEVRVAGQDATLACDETCVVAATGSPRFDDSRLAEQARSGGTAAVWLASYRDQKRLRADIASGPFAVAILDLGSKRALFATDRFSIRPICYAVEGGRVEFADRADAVRSRGGEIDPQALLDYLYFHVIPAPRTAFRGVRRVPAATQVVVSGGRSDESPWWHPHFEARPGQPLPVLKAEFRQIVRNAVSRAIAGRSAVGAFLSGGTDSSTVSGMIGEITGRPARTFSIGFDAEDYDEMAYARIAARHFRTEHHEYYLTPEDLIAGIPEVAAHYDQPFGNSSALPAYFCAKLARRAGVQTMLAGDGGDELFGGNTRYAKQRVFGLYDGVPALLQRGLIEPVVLGLPALSKVPLARKVASYVAQARVPMPERMEMYNPLLRLGLDKVLVPEFRSKVDLGDPPRQQRAIWERCAAPSVVDRMLAFDWKYTLSDNDLPKVVGATELAGIRAGFPLLADEVVDFSLALPPDLKLKGFKLRWLFKEAMRGFLPEETLAKKKHGFGLPFGVWLTKHAGLREFALDALRPLDQRGIVRREFLDDLVGRLLSEHPGYYGEMIWILMMLEVWLSRRGAPVFAHATG